MKMKIPVRRSCLTLIVLSAIVEAIRANDNENSTAESRQGRVSGRIVKLYSEYKPDPVLCIEEGFTADPVQCSIFYRCVKSSSGKFTVFKFQCGPGTVYDPETEVCNHPSSTKRSECGGLKLQAEQNNENEINEIEVNELPSPISTILPVYTNQAMNVTSFKVPIISTPVTSDKSQPSTENGYLYSLTTSPPYKIETVTKEVQDINNNLVTNPWANYKNTTQQKIVPSTTIFPLLENRQPCTSDGFMGDRENCKKFYRCVSNFRGGFIRYELVCSEPTVWDDHMQSCNHPWAVRNSRCGRNGLNSEKLTYEPSKQTSNLFDDKYSETTNRNIVDDSKRNGYPFQYGDRINNKDEKYLEKDQILYGSNSNQQTTPNKNWESEPTDRDKTDNLNNNYNLVQTTTAQSIYLANKLESGDENNDMVLQSNVNNKVIHCKQSGFIGDSHDCKKFYRCVENGRGSFTKYEFTCSQGTVWDNKIEACNYAWAVKECGDKSYIQSSPVTVDTQISTSTSANAATSESDNLEYGYINEISQQHEPSTTITVSTPVSLIYTTTVNYNQIGMETECTVAGFNADKNDCKKFYRCVENGKGTYTKYEYKCGDGTLWDQNIEACNHAWAVKSCTTDLDNNNIHKMNISTTLSTTSLVEPTTPGKTEDNNSYNEAYRPEKDGTTLDPGKDLTNTDKSITIVPSQRNDCESSGFMGDANDCRKFYRCVDNGQRGFNKYEFSCGDGTVWDSEIEACNHAWSVKCGTSKPLKHETISSSIPTTHSSTNINDIGLTTTASFIQTSTTQREISEYDSGYGQQHSVSTVKPNLETSTLKQIQNQTNNCETSGFIGDVNDCNKFYRCVDNGHGGFIQYEFSCGEGTVWDPEIEACNHAWAVKHCGIPSKEDTLTSSSTQLNVVDSNSEYLTQNYIDNEYTTSNNNLQTTTVPNGNYNNECTSNGFMGDKNDCKKFYRCVDSGNGTYTKYVFSCGEGTVWDHQINACNHAWAVKDCNSSEDLVTNVSVKPTTQTSSNENIDGHDNTNNYAETTNRPSSAATSITVAHSGNKCESSGFMSDKNDCQKFYRCVDNGDGSFTKHEFKCGEGTVWDSKIEACNHKWAVEKCGVSSNENLEATTQLLPSNSPTESEATTRTTLYATSTSLSSSTSTIQPINDEQTEESNTTKLTTSASMSTTDSSKPEGTNVCKEEGYYGDTKDCKKFYRCVFEGNGKFTKYDFICADGTIWDQDITTCNHPYDVKNPSCTSKPESTTTVSTVLTSTANNEIPPSNSNNTIEPDSTNGEEVSNNNETCSNCNSTTEHSNTNNYTCTKAGFYADPSDCKKFYRCVDWENNGKKFSIYHFDCADGTIWDPALETCNHEDSVYPPRNCKGLQQQSESTTETTTDKSTTTTFEPSKTTSQSPTTTENTSTQTTQTPTTQSSTTGESTTQSSTSEESTTQTSTSKQPTTQFSTTQSSTTQEPSTQSSTTEASTTQSSTTEVSTTQSSTTEELTTQSTTTKEPTTEETTTQSTVAMSTTNEQSTQPVSTTTETDQDQTTKLSTLQTTNEETTTLESSTTTTQMTTSSSDQTSTTTEQSTSTTETSSTTENNSESSTETSTNKECPDTDNDQSLYVCPTSFKRHPKYCNLFYQCTEDNESHELKMAVFNCPNNTIYDEQKIQCVEEKESTKKCNGQISQKHRVKRLGPAYNEPFVVTKEAMTCRSTGHFPFEKHTECSPSLLKCELTKSGKLRGFVYRCPEGFVYWNISRRCEPLAKVRDCKRSSYKWNTRYDVPLERYNIASK